MKKIGFIIPGLKSGGAERVLSTISLNLDKKYKQYLFTWNKEKDYDFDSEIIQIDMSNSKFCLMNAFVLYYRVKELKKYKKKYNLDTCISHLEGANFVNILSKCQEKTIITVHSYQSSERKGIKGFIYKILIKLLYNHADAVVAVSQMIKDDLVKNFKIKEENVHVIYNPFDLDSINKQMLDPIESNYSEIFDKTVIINVGRLSEAKGQWNLIKSFSILSSKRKDVALVILGKGELEESLREIVEKLKLNNVYFLGFSSNPFKYIYHSKIFALSSQYEGFPMCLAEAMTCKTPIVSVDCISGPREMLCDKPNISMSLLDTMIASRGILTPPMLSLSFDLEIDESHIKYAQALEGLLDDVELQNCFIDSGLQYIETLRVETILQNWYKLIEG